MNYFFKYNGKTYECCGDDKDLQIRNFNHCIETRDWNTLQNRIKNQLKWTPKDLVEVKEKRIFKLHVKEIPKGEEQKYVDDIAKKFKKEIKTDNNFW